MTIDEPLTPMGNADPIPFRANLGGAIVALGNARSPK